ncbi:MAG: T9SS type A sorting domain-containing protein [Chitinophagales bacterium]|nr:T9SS type A sorting domain-containing protein [Chitinophagales bacterium]MBP9220367.1 T9SS type A sorting domain-containing protein [Chitinophagales bacterium]
MRFYFIILLLTSFSAFLNGQITYSTLNFGDTISNNRGSASLVDADLNVYFAGTISNGLMESDDVALYKFGMDGNIIWNYNYGNEESEFVNNMVFTIDSFLIICGDVRDAETSDLDGFIMKFDTSGNLIFYQTYGSDSTNEDFYGITILQDGNIAITGFITSTVGTGNDVLFVEYSTDGNVLNEFVFGSNMNDVGMGIAETEEGDIIISGDRATTGLYYNAFIAKINNSNEIVWDHFVSLPVNSGCKTVQRTSGGNFILCGETASEISPLFDILLVSFDSEGNIILLNTIPGIGVEAAYDITEAQYGEYFLTGFGYNPSTENNDIIVVYVDNTLTEIERKYFGGTGADLGYDIKTDGFGNFWVSGFTAVGDNVMFTLIYDGFDLITEIKTDEFLKMNIDVYPNPAQGYIIIQSKVILDKFEIVDIYGRILYAETYPQLKNKIALSPNFKNGLLLIKMYQGNEVYTKKIIAG